MNIIHESNEALLARIARAEEERRILRIALAKLEKRVIQLEDKEK